MQEKEVVVVPDRFQTGTLVVERLAGIEHVHADQSRQAAVHRVDSDRRGPQSIQLFKRGNRRPLVDPAHREKVGRGIVLQHLASLREERLGDLRRLLRGSVAGHRVKRSHARLLRVGVFNVPAQPLTTEDDHQAIFLHRANEHLDARNLDLVELRAQLGANLAGDPPRPAIGDDPRLVQRAEVTANRDIVGAQVKVDAQRFQHPATNLKLKRVVPEQPQMARPRTRRDARQHRRAQAQHAIFRQRIEVRRLRGLQFRLAPGSKRQPPQTIRHAQHDLRFILDRQFLHQIVQIHEMPLSLRENPNVIPTRRTLRRESVFSGPERGRQVRGIASADTEAFPK